MTDGSRPRSGGSQRGPTPDPARRPAAGVADLRGRLQSGYGSPEGVVPAGTGVQYQDTDPAGSGSIWKKTTPGGKTGWVELGAGGGGGGGGTFLRVYLCGGNAVQADFNNAHTVNDLLVSFSAPTTVEQSGGFVFSDHPSALQWDIDTSSAVAATHGPHRIEVPEAGLYTVSLDVAPSARFTSAVSPWFMDITIQPEGITLQTWVDDAAAANTLDGGFGGVSEVWTVPLDPAFPFWFEIRIFGRTGAGAHLAPDISYLYDASLTVEKDDGAGSGGALHAFSATGEDNATDDDLSGPPVVAKCEAAGVFSDAEGLYDPSTGKYAAPEAGWYMLTASYHTIGAPPVLLQWQVPGVAGGPRATMAVDQPFGLCDGLVYISTPGDIYVEVSPTSSTPGATGRITNVSIAKLG